MLGSSTSGAALQGRVSKATMARVQPYSTRAGLGEGRGQDWGQAVVGDGGRPEPGSLQQDRGPQRETYGGRARPEQETGTERRWREVLTVLVRLSCT